MRNQTLGALVLLLSAGAACKDPPPPPPQPKPALRPGIDLTEIHPIALDPVPEDERGAAPADLTADPRLVKVTLPRIPAGGTASFDVDGAHKGWITRLPHGAPIPTAAYGDSRVYVGSGFQSRSFYALDAETGHVEWADHDLTDDGPTAALYEEGRVLFNTESCTLFALDGKTGRRLWTRWLGDPTLSQPAADGGLVYAAFPQDGGTWLGAFTLKDGALVWSRAVDGELISAPAIAGNAVFAATIKGTTYSFDKRGGRALWAKRGRASSAPFVVAGALYESRVAEGGKKEEQVSLDARTGATIEVLAAADARYLGDVPRTLDDWNKVWSFDGSRPVLAGGRRFDTMGGEVRAGDPMSAASMWTRGLKGGAGKRSLTPPAVAASKVVFASQDGDLYVLDADTGITVFAYRLGVPIRAQPIVAKGWVYLTTGTGSVIGLSLSDPSFDGWHMWGGSPTRNG